MRKKKGENSDQHLFCSSPYRGSMHMSSKGTAKLLARNRTQPLHQAAIALNIIVHHLQDCPKVAKESKRAHKGVMFIIKLEVITCIWSDLLAYLGGLGMPTDFSI